MSLKIFNFEENNEIRTIIKDNDYYFVARDVAKILEYKNTKQAIIDNVDEEDIKYAKNMGVFQDDLNIKLQKNTKLLNESGIYSLILSSKKPQAKKFKRFVTNELLPSLRKNGYYIKESDTTGTNTDTDTEYYDNLNEKVGEKMDEIDKEEIEKQYKNDKDIINLEKLSEKMHLLNHNFEIIKEYGIHTTDTNRMINYHFEYLIKKHLEDFVDNKVDNNDNKNDNKNDDIYYTISERIYNKGFKYDTNKLKKIALIVSQVYKNKYNKEPEKRRQIINKNICHVNCYSLYDYNLFIDKVIKKIYKGLEPESLKYIMK